MTSRRCRIIVVCCHMCVVKYVYFVCDYMFDIMYVLLHQILLYFLDFLKENVFLFRFLSFFCHQKRKPKIKILV